MGDPTIRIEMSITRFVFASLLGCCAQTGCAYVYVCALFAEWLTLLFNVFGSPLFHWGRCLSMSVSMLR